MGREVEGVRGGGREGWREREVEGERGGGSEGWREREVEGEREAEREKSEGERSGGG